MTFWTFCVLLTVMLPFSEQFINTITLSIRNYYSAQRQYRNNPIFSTRIHFVQCTLCLTTPRNFHCSIGGLSYLYYTY